VTDRALDHPLKTDRLLQDVFAAFGDLFDLFIEKGLDVARMFSTLPPQFSTISIRSARKGWRTECARRSLFVPALFGFPHGKAQSGGQFFADHSLVSFHGALERETLFRARLSTMSILLSATSSG